MRHHNLRDRWTFFNPLAYDAYDALLLLVVLGFLQLVENSRKNLAQEVSSCRFA